MATKPSTQIETTNPKAVISPYQLRQREKALSVERRKVQRAAKARAKAIGSVWDDE